MQNQKKTQNRAASMPTLEGELLGLVLSCLTKGEDIIRCCMVSKAWAEASKHARYTSLTLYHGLLGGTELQFAQAQLRWLQGLQKDGQLDHLQRAALCAGNLIVNQAASPSFLSQGLVVLAGTWHLREVILTGPICYATAVAMLPTSLVALELWPDHGPVLTHLSDFKRFKKLQVLKLAIACNTGSDSSDYDFKIQTVFPGLKFLAVHDCLRCSISPSCDIGTCLPNMQHISLRVKVDEAGAQFT